MIVIDTSVWANHFHRQIPELIDCLAGDEVLQHPFVTGEIAMGNLRTRHSTIAFLESLDAAPVSSDSHFLTFVDTNELGGKGIGFVDTHLLVSAALSGAKLWTNDGRLAAQANRLGLNFEL